MAVRVHINGITRPEDAAAAVEAGADSFGLYFWNQSSSSVSIARAKEIVAAVPAEAMTIAMFVDAVARTVERTLEQTGIKLASFAGNEDPEYCRRFSGRYVKVIRVRGIQSVEEMDSYDCPFYILDGDPAVQSGVREIPFDLTMARRAKRKGKIVISGGNTIDNVASSIKTIRPWGVEVSAGVESVQGRKDPYKLQRFVELCKTA